MISRAFLAFALGVAALSPVRSDMITFANTVAGVAPSEFEFARTGGGSACKWIVVADDTAEGDRFTVTYDDKPLYTVTDKTIAQAGKVALWTKADSVTRFDRVDIKPLP